MLPLNECSVIISQLVILGNVLKKPKRPCSFVVFAFNKREANSGPGRERSLNTNIGLREIPKTPLRPLGSDLPERRPPREITEN